MDEMFDLLEDEDEEELEDEEEVSETEDLDDVEEEIIPYEYGIDFSTGQLTGEIVSGSEAVKVWAWLALQSARYRYLIYSWDYGVELENLIGTQFSEEFTEARARKMIEECLMENPNITDISNFRSDFSGDTLTLMFDIGTEFGEEEMTVNV